MSGVIDTRPDGTYHYSQERKRQFDTEEEEEHALEELLESQLSLLKRLGKV